VREFAGTYAPETVAACLRDSAARLPAARIAGYHPLFAYRFARERLRADAIAAGRLPRTRPQVLFVCTHNTARSQLAAALLEQAGAGRVEVRSAGTDPAAQADPTVAHVLAEAGVPLEGAFPKPLTDEVVQAADIVITMGCGDACPVLPGRRYLGWDLPDPAGADGPTVRQVAARIAALVQDLLTDLDRKDAG